MGVKMFDQMSADDQEAMIDAMISCIGTLRQKRDRLDFLIERARDDQEAMIDAMISCIGTLRQERDSLDFLIERAREILRDMRKRRADKHTAGKHTQEISPFTGKTVLDIVYGEENDL